MQRIVIIGMGFGGLAAARELAGSGMDVLVLDRNNYHLFQPLLYQVATAGLEQESIAQPVRTIIRKWHGVRFQMAEVHGVDFERREVQTSDGPIGYDSLIIAAGSATNFFGMQAVQEQAYDLKQLNDSVALRNHILTMFEQAHDEPDANVRAELLTFVVVGGGPTGVEFAGALAELVRNVLSRDYQQELLNQTRIILVEASDKVLAPFDPKLRAYTVARLRKLGIDVRLETSVTDATPTSVRLKDGTSIATRTLFWAAGVKAAPLAEAINVPKGRAGRIVVQPDLSIEGHKNVYVIGDIAYLEQDGQPLPMVAPVAMQQGKYVAALLRGQQQGAFRYKDKGSMAVIGRNAAVTQVLGLKMRGFLAWVAWLGLHLIMLVGFRNRIVTLFNWAYDYVLFERHMRLITGQGKPTAQRGEEASSGYAADTRTADGSEQARGSERG